jgi:hypothetical protein
LAEIICSNLVTSSLGVLMVRPTIFWISSPLTKVMSRLSFFVCSRNAGSLTALLFQGDADCAGHLRFPEAEDGTSQAGGARGT